MTRIALILFFCIFVTACAGRVAQPVAETSPFDDRLSCAHIRGEMEQHLLRFAELRGESRMKVGYNALALTNPILWDLSDTQRVEAEALRARLLRLEALGETQSCEGLDEIEVELGVEAEG